MVAGRAEWLTRARLSKKSKVKRPRCETDTWGTRSAHHERKKEKRDSSHPQADAFAGTKAEEKIGLLRSE